MNPTDNPLQANCYVEGGTVQLQSALLIYGNAKSTPACAYASVHPVLHSEQGPIIQPGRPFNYADLEALYGALRQSTKSVGGATWIDDRTLAVAPDRAIWYTRPRSELLTFKAGSLQRAGRAMVPGFVWMATPNGLFQWALPTAGRPLRTTQLAQSPMFNVWSRGKVCAGSVQWPALDAPLEHWERAFFGSEFTHPNFSEKDRLIVGQDPHAYWASALDNPTRPFPKKRLFMLPLTIEDLLRIDFAAALAETPQARGEF